MTNKKSKKTSTAKQKAPESTMIPGHSMIDETPSCQLSHEDFVYILRGMRIDVPPHTKIPAEKLQERLKKHSLPLNVPPIISMILKRSSRQLTQSPCLFAKLDQILSAFCELGPRQGRLPKLDWFSIDDREITARQASAILYFFFEQVEEFGIDCVSYLDEKNWRALIVRVLSVRMVDENTPMVLVAYRAVQAKNRNLLRDYVMKTFDTPKGRTAFQATTQVQKLLEMYFALNGTRLPDEFKPPSVIEESSPYWKYGFVLPLGELLPTDIGSLSVFEGCATCGEEANHSCVRCDNVRYCSKACQKHDFHAHRSLCRAVSSGTWTTITLESNPWGETKEPGGHIGVINHTTGSVSYIESEELESVPKNRYGDKYFLLKLQCPMVGPQSFILVYDVHRSFTLYMLEDKNGEAIKVALRQFSPEKRPIFRWAKRIGYWEWNVCFESVPEYVSPW